MATDRGRAEGSAGGLASFYPGYFSIASLFEGWTAAAWLLFGVNLVAYPVLWAVTLARLARAPRRLLADLVDHRRGP